MDALVDHYDPEAARAYRLQVAERRQLSSRAELRLFERSLKCFRSKVMSPRSVLDCPAGTGRLSAALVRECDSVVAIDGSLSMSRLSTYRDGVEQPRVMVGRLPNLPLKDNSVDVAVCWRFLHHLFEAERRVEVLKELGRVARHGIIISTWTTANWAGMRRRRKSRPQKRFAIPTKDTRKDLADAGFEVVDVFYKARFFSPITVWVARRGESLA